MKEVSPYRLLIDTFRGKNEENFIFACQAAVPLILTSDLLYQLWNNFKQYKYLFFEEGMRPIPYTVVSDLLMSGLCREVGFELFEIRKELRDLLLDDLLLTLGEKRKNTIAAFLEDYALREYRYSHRKNLKDIHLLTARSMLNPAEMEKQIIEKINQSSSDSEKINYLLLHKSLSPLGFDSDLHRITEAMPAGNNDSWSPILIAEVNPEAPGVLQVKLPSVLNGRIRKERTTSVHAVRADTVTALDLINSCFENQSTELDLGNCGLSEQDFTRDSPVLNALLRCIFLEKLILSNSWFDVRVGTWQKSRNSGKRNKFSRFHFPFRLPLLSNFSEMICAGEPGDEWNISDIRDVENFPKLKYLDLSYNRISETTPLNECTGLEFLLLGFNRISVITEFERLKKIRFLDLDSNLITDLKPLMVLLSRPEYAMEITLTKPTSLQLDLIIVRANPLAKPWLEAVQQGHGAVLQFFINKIKQESFSDIKALAKKFEAYRDSLPASDERTIGMTNIVNEMELLAADIQLLLPELTNSDSPGERLAAIASLKMLPKVEYADWLSEHVGDAEQFFIGFHASVALRNAANHSTDEIRGWIAAAVKKARSNVESAKNKDPNQVAQLQAAIEILGIRGYYDWDNADEEVSFRPKAKPIHRWVCQTWKENPKDFDSPHIFDNNSDDGFCPEEPAYHGILLREMSDDLLFEINITLPQDRSTFKEGTSITIIAETVAYLGNITRVEFFMDDKKFGEDTTIPYSYPLLLTRGGHILTAKAWNDLGNVTVSNPVRITVDAVLHSEPEIGLGLMLIPELNATEPLFAGNPISLSRIVAASAASGIFDLERMYENPTAFFGVWKYSDQTELIILDSISNLLVRYENVSKFSNSLYEQFSSLQMAGNINQALTDAHTFVDKFLHQRLASFATKNYKILYQRILKFQTSEAVSIPNIRVLILSNGSNPDSNSQITNPFLVSPIHGLHHDVLIGAHFGTEDDLAYKALHDSLSRCPIHDKKQLFLFDNPQRISNLKFLLRMVAGTSGFCPKCLEQELAR